MRKWYIAAIAASVLTACGADGEPVQPTRDATIVISDSGVSGLARVGVTRGPLAVSLGLGL